MRSSVLGGRKQQRSLSVPGPAWPAEQAPLSAGGRVRINMFVYSPICYATDQLVLVSLGLESLFPKGLRQSVSV